MKWPILCKPLCLSEVNKPSLAPLDNLIIPDMPHTFKQRLDEWENAASPAFTLIFKQGQIHHQQRHQRSEIDVQNLITWGRIADYIFDIEGPPLVTVFCGGYISMVTLQSRTC